jgi:hypothetical protein
VLAASGMLNIVSWCALGQESGGLSWILVWPVAGALLGTTVVMILVSRWLGRRQGVLAGLVWAGMTALAAGWLDPWLATLSCCAVALFAVAQAPGRLPLITGFWPPAGFYLVLTIVLLWFGPGPAVSIAAVCVACLAVSQNTKGIRFLVNPAGIFTLASVTGVWLLSHWSEVAVGNWPACDGVFSAIGPVAGEAAIYPRWIPWGLYLPFAAVGVITGMWQGHHNTPWGRLVGCWAAAPIVLSGFGLISLPETLALVLPATTLLAATGVTRLCLLPNRRGRLRPSIRG